MPPWMHDVLDVVLSWWPLAVIGVALVPGALVGAVREPSSSRGRSTSPCGPPAG